MGKKILYIEDEPFFAKLITKQLTNAGFAVTVKADGESGLKVATEEQFELIFLDLILPKLGGFDVLKKLKENENTKHTPVVILSNLSSDEDRKKADGLGAHMFCVKMSTYPQYIVELAEKILGSGA